MDVEFLMKEKERLLKTYNCKTLEELLQYFEAILSKNGQK